MNFYIALAMINYTPTYWKGSFLLLNIKIKGLTIPKKINAVYLVLHHFNNWLFTNVFHIIDNTCVSIMDAAVVTRLTKYNDFSVLLSSSTLHFRDHPCYWVFALDSTNWHNCTYHPSPVMHLVNSARVHRMYIGTSPIMYITYVCCLVYFSIKVRLCRSTD